MKPSLVPFIAAAQTARTVPRRTLFVGDSMKHDIAGAKAAGMCTILIQRDIENSVESIRSSFVRDKEECKLFEDEMKPDIILNSLHPEEFRSKLYNFIRENYM
jgi:FMN phosphatase YigB (HAD superfamily)